MSVSLLTSALTSYSEGAQQPFEEDTATSIIRRYGWLKHGYPTQPEEAQCACCSGAHNPAKGRPRGTESANPTFDVIEERTKGKNFIVGNPATASSQRAASAHRARSRSRGPTRPADNLAFTYAGAAFSSLPYGSHGGSSSSTREAVNPPPPKDIASLRAHTARGARQRKGGPSYLTVIVHKGGMLSVDVGEVGSVLIRCGKFEGQTSFEERRQNKMLRWEERFTMPIDPFSNDPLEVYVLKGKVRSEKGGHAVGATAITNDLLHSELRGFREQVPVRSIREMFVEDGPARGFVEMTWQVSDGPAGTGLAGGTNEISNGVDTPRDRSFGDSKVLYSIDSVGGTTPLRHQQLASGVTTPTAAGRANRADGSALSRGSSAAVSPLGSRRPSQHVTSSNFNNNITNNTDGALDKATRAIRESQRNATLDEDENPKLPLSVALRLTVNKVFLLGHAGSTSAPLADSSVRSSVAGGKGNSTSAIVSPSPAHAYAQQSPTAHHKGELYVTLHNADGSCSEAATLFRTREGTTTSLATLTSSTHYAAGTALDGESTGTIAHDVANRFVSLLCCFDQQQSDTNSSDDEGEGLHGGLSSTRQHEKDDQATNNAPLALRVVGSVVLDVEEFLTRGKGTVVFTLGDKEGYVGEMEVSWAAVVIDADFEEVRSTAAERAAARRAERRMNRRRRRAEALGVSVEDLPYGDDSEEGEDNDEVEDTAHTNDLFTAPTAQDNLQDDEDEEEDGADKEEEGFVHAPVGLSLTVIRGVDLVRPNGIPIRDPVISIAVGPMEAQTHPITDERYEENDFTSSDEEENEKGEGGGRDADRTPLSSLPFASSTTSSAAAANKAIVMSFADIAKIYGCSVVDVARLNQQKDHSQSHQQSASSLGTASSSIDRPLGSKPSTPRGGMHASHGQQGGNGKDTVLPTIVTTASVPASHLIVLPPRTRAETVDSFCRRTGLTAAELSRLNPTLINPSDIIRPQLKVVVPAAPHSEVAARRLAMRRASEDATKSTDQSNRGATDGKAKASLPSRGGLDQGSTSGDGDVNRTPSKRLPKEERRRLRRRLIPSDIVWNQEMRFLDIFDEDGSLPETIEVFVHETGDERSASSSSTSSTNPEDDGLRAPEGAMRCVGYGEAPLATSITGATVINIYPTAEALEAYGSKRKVFRRCESAPDGVVEVTGGSGEADYGDREGEEEGAVDAERPIGQIIVKFAWETEKIAKRAMAVEEEEGGRERADGLENFDDNDHQGEVAEDPYLRSAYPDQYDDDGVTTSRRQRESSSDKRKADEECDEDLPSTVGVGYGHGGSPYSGVREGSYGDDDSTSGGPSGIRSGAPMPTPRGSTAIAPSSSSSRPQQYPFGQGRGQDVAYAHNTDSTGVEVTNTTRAESRTTVVVDQQTYEGSSVVSEATTTTTTTSHIVSQIHMPAAGQSELLKGRNVSPNRRAAAGDLGAATPSSRKAGARHTPPLSSSPSNTPLLDPAKKAKFQQFLLQRVAMGRRESNASGTSVGSADKIAAAVSHSGSDPQRTKFTRDSSNTKTIMNVHPTVEEIEKERRASVISDVGENRDRDAGSKHVDARARSRSGSHSRSTSFLSTEDATLNPRPAEYNHLLRGHEGEERVGGAVRRRNDASKAKGEGTTAGLVETARNSNINSRASSRSGSVDAERGARGSESGPSAKPLRAQDEYKTYPHYASAAINRSRRGSQASLNDYEGIGSNKKRSDVEGNKYTSNRSNDLRAAYGHSRRSSAANTPASSRSVSPAQSREGSRSTSPTGRRSKEHFYNSRAPAAGREVFDGNPHYSSQSDKDNFGVPTTGGVKQASDGPRVRAGLRRGTPGRSRSPSAASISREDSLAGSTLGRDERVVKGEDTYRSYAPAYSGSSVPTFGATSANGRLDSRSPSRAGNSPVSKDKDLGGQSLGPTETRGKPNITPISIGSERMSRQGTNTSTASGSGPSAPISSAAPFLTPRSRSGRGRAQADTPTSSQSNPIVQPNSAGDGSGPHAYRRHDSSLHSRPIASYDVDAHGYAFDSFGSPTLADINMKSASSISNTARTFAAGLGSSDPAMRSNISTPTVCVGRNEPHENSPSSPNRGGAGRSSYFSKTNTSTSNATDNRAFTPSTTSSSVNPKGITLRFGPRRDEANKASGFGPSSEPGFVGDDVGSVANARGEAANGVDASRRGRDTATYHASSTGSSSPSRVRFGSSEEVYDPYPRHRDQGNGTRDQYTSDPIASDRTGSGYRTPHHHHRYAPHPTTEDNGAGGILSPTKTRRSYGERHHVNPTTPRIRSRSTSTPRLKATIGERPWYPPGKPTDDSRYPLHLQKKTITEQDRIEALEQLLKAEEAEERRLAAEQRLLLQQQHQSYSFQQGGPSIGSLGGFSRAGSAKRSSSVRSRAFLTN